MPTHGAYTSSLEQEGLITTVGPRRGRIVRVPPRRAVRSSERHQLEKERAILPLPERAEIGEAETNLDMSIGEQMFTAAYDTISASEDLARVLQVRAGDPLLRRIFVSTDPRTGRCCLAVFPTSPGPSSRATRPCSTRRTSHGPAARCTSCRPSDRDHARGRSRHRADADQRRSGSVGSAARCSPSAVPAISVDAGDGTIEISDAEYPADRTELRFVTPLNPWPKPQGARA